ncbi:sugar phosphate isomerase/epimerase [Radiobacillus kanasensis]|uniref:sugar phosphate isomerase/epimerase family protein n=1 Tax=Radiobacillus kanasensis TaxID=2844358 RepID=UPI001E3C01FB|nr:sugar phosphate isomerase/epimerase family protein [Radiobacillus kanasensis]UFU00115.1 sugar phosphate isomerase/epimerase [Radiobacillus kanasensis]
MRLFVSSSLCWAYPPDDVIKLANQFHFDGVEIWAEHVWHYHTSIDSILQAKEDYDIELSLHAASWDLNLSAINEGIRMQSIYEIEKSMILAKEIGATNVTIHPGRYTLTNEWIDKHKEIFIHNLQILAEKADQLEVTLSLELMEPLKKEFITEPASMNQILEHLPENVQTTFDVAHVPLSKKPLDYFHRMNRINKVHISDSTDQIYHVPLGTGSIDLHPILEELVYSDLPIVVEGFENDRSLAKLQQNLSYLNKKSLLRRKTIEDISH